MADQITDEMVEAALTAFNASVNAPQMVPCPKCEGRGYHHGYGEDGADPDWCRECGGNQFNVVPGEEERAMRAALESAARVAPELVAVKPLEWRDHYKGSEFRGGERANASTILGDYQVYGDGSWSGPHKFHAAVPGVLGKLATAKAAAQADYEQRIMSALSAPPVRPAALRSLPVQEEGE